MNEINKLQELAQPVNKDLKERGDDYYRNKALIESISEGAIFVHVNGTISLFNRAAEKILQKHDVLGKNYWDLFTDSEFGFSMRSALLFGSAHTTLRRKDLEIHTHFIFEGPKSSHGMLLIIKELGEKERLLTEIRRGDLFKELGQMTANVAHEMRNKLGAVKGFAALLFRDLAYNQNLQEMASFILEGTKSLENLSLSLLHFTKPVQLERLTVDITLILRKLYKSIETNVPPKCKAALHLPNASLFVPVNEEALQSVLLNLIYNAFQAMPEGGMMTLSALQIDSSCQISVSDTGIGIEEEVMKNLFSPFFTTKKGGNGLGLVETKKIIDAHGGKIDVRSQKGKGTTFTIMLPCKG